MNEEDSKQSSRSFRNYFLFVNGPFVAPSPNGNVYCVSVLPHDHRRVCTLATSGHVADAVLSMSNNQLQRWKKNSETVHFFSIEIII